MDKLIKKEGKFYNECRVVMLETQNSNNALKGYLKNTMLFNYQKEYKTTNAEKGITGYFHLYITSDDVIKKDEWVVRLSSGEIFKAPLDRETKSNDFKKIIATTDTSLKIITGMVGSGTGILLPQPSDKFIQAFIEAYNSGNKIEKVSVEYECPQCQEWGYVSECRKDCNQRFLQPKFKDNNNIIIKKVKDSWNREEVIKIYKQGARDYCNSSQDVESFFSKYGDGTKWIDENL